MIYHELDKALLQSKYQAWVYLDWLVKSTQLITNIDKSKGRVLGGKKLKLKTLDNQIYTP